MAIVGKKLRSVGIWILVISCFPFVFSQQHDRIPISSPIHHSSTDHRRQDNSDIRRGDHPLPVDELERNSDISLTQERLTYRAEFERPYQLLKPGEGHDRLELNELAVEKLASIPDVVSLISAVGPYHGGKSFLLNVLLNSTHGFDVGAVPEPETRGIWMRMVAKERISGVDGSLVVFLDTEGFYGEGATRSYDARIFALATLLSSHLVYNTLRTLGDAQSVSSLADLAKQAQVFNMQNWLHTGDAVADHASAPLDVDPTLLLKTLEFPPLTWVVQGFDIGLHSSQTPMDYLQRYLSAHAHSGDRTLDTLFTRGIRCHTLRTPTDLNALREAVGDEGLAAQEELYPYLHSGYLADVDALRHTIFGNLTGKGGFTGKDLAALLPLLVHYVNDDFPLNAERKLRDVLVDVVVDGAFSGGAQYFQLCMSTLPDKEKVLSKRQGKEVDVANAKLESAQGGARLKALAASAFTLDEMEQLLSAAERRAIEYCKQRSVGVPLEKARVSCEAQLGVKLERMKPRYRDENDQRVREVLVLLGQGFRVAAEKEMDDLLLPMRESDIQLRCKQASMDALKRYELLVGPHKGGPLYKEAWTQMQIDVQAKCDKVYRVNADKISVILSRGKTAYRVAYEETIAKEGCGPRSGEIQQQGETTLGPQRPCSSKRLAEIDKVAQLAAQAEFDKSVEKEGLPWLGPGVEQYDFQTYQCAQWSTQRFKEFQAQNDARLRAYCDFQAATLAHQYREEVGKIVPFPDNDEVLTTKTGQLEKHFVDEYAALVKDFLPSGVAEENKKELIRTIRELKEHHLRKNTALMRAFCYDPLHDAYKELRMQDCERTYESMWRTKGFWSLKCLWPGPKYTFGFKYSAYVAARKHLDLASKASSVDGRNGVVLSAATRNKVIESWIEQDLGAHAHLVFLNFTVLVVLVVVLGASLAWLFCVVQSRTSGGAYTGSATSAFRDPRNGKRSHMENVVKNEGRKDRYFGVQQRPQRW
ncbi:unnamed protein product [Calypogeia fissa]